VNELLEGPEQILLRFVEPVEFVRSALRFDPDPKQEELLGMTGKRVLLNCTRQWGQSTVWQARIPARPLFGTTRLV
jgi:hypothetical protein